VDRRAKVELYEQIRREYEHGPGTIRAVSRKLGVHRREVRRALESAIPAERKVPEREHPKLAPAIPFINAILESDRKAPRKQRHTAHRIWMRLRREMPEVEVSGSTIRRYVRMRKAAMGLLGHEIFVPQSYQFGGEAQVDWYEGWVLFDRESRKMNVFCMRSMASGAAFHRACPVIVAINRQSQFYILKTSVISGNRCEQPSTGRSRSGSIKSSHFMFTDSFCSFLSAVSTSAPSTYTKM